MLEEEDAQLKGKAPKPPGPARVTRAQIDEALQKELKEGGDSAGGGERGCPLGCGRGRLGPGGAGAAGQGRETIRRSQSLLTCRGLREGQPRSETASLPPSGPSWGGGLVPVLPADRSFPGREAEEPPGGALGGEPEPAGAGGGRGGSPHHRGGHRGAQVGLGRLCRGFRVGECLFRGGSRGAPSRSGRQRPGPLPVGSLAEQGALLCPLALSACGAPGGLCGHLLRGSPWGGAGPSRTSRSLCHQPRGGAAAPLPSFDPGWGSARFLGAWRAWGGAFRRAGRLGAPPPRSLGVQRGWEPASRAKGP